MNNQIEIWKDIPEYQGKYQVSNFGRVKSLGNDKGRKEKILKHKLIIHRYKNRDYIKHQIELCKNGNGKSFLIHRLVWTAFKGKIPNGYQVDHINNNPQNNRLDNLQLLTRSENEKKKFIDNPNYKTLFTINNPKKKIICLNNNMIYESVNDAARKLNIYSQHISDVLKGKRKHTHGYTFKYLEQ